MSIPLFFKSKSFAVVGVSQDVSKFGYKVFTWYQEHGLPVIPVHPKATHINDIPCIASIELLIDPSTVSVSFITPPQVTEEILSKAIELGIRNVWMQPGAQPPKESLIWDQLKNKNVNTIADGSCILVKGNLGIKMSSL